MDDHLSPFEVWKANRADCSLFLSSTVSWHWDVDALQWVAPQAVGKGVEKTLTCDCLFFVSMCTCIYIAFVFCLLYLSISICFKHMPPFQLLAQHDMGIPSWSPIEVFSDPRVATCTLEWPFTDVRQHEDFVIAWRKDFNDFPGWTIWEPWGCLLSHKRNPFKECRMRRRSLKAWSECGVGNMWLGTLDFQPWLLVKHVCGVEQLEFFPDLTSFKMDPYPSWLSMLKGQNYSSRAFTFASSGWNGEYAKSPHQCL